MPNVLLVCRDLMTASRFETGLPAGVRQVARVEEVVGALRLLAAEDVIVVDLAAFPDLPRLLRDEHGYRGPMLAFAPHVQEELIASAKLHADEVVPRGAAVRRVAAIVGGTGA